MEHLFYRNREIRKIGFFGLGRSTRGMLSWFKSRFSHLEFILRLDKPLAKEDEILHSFSEIRIGDESEKGFYENIIFFSPSVRRERFSSLNNTLLSSDAEYFIDNTKSDVFAITGSDGKSTTVTLCQKILSAFYSEAFAIGNIGEAMTPYLKKDFGTAAVCELSSFQLSYFSPSVKRALITNVTPNHLDWHTSYEEYIAAKENIYRFAKEPILNSDCPISSKIMERYKPFAVYSATKNLEEIRSHYKSEHYIYVENGEICHNGKPLLQLKNIACRGNHNIYNFLAAAALCCDMPIKDALEETAKGFLGLPHRCCTVAIKNGVEFIDSSIDSSPKRTETTLLSLPDRPIIILGGKSKGLGFEELIPVLNKKAKAIFLTGETGSAIHELLKNCSTTLPTFYYADFEAAVLAAAKFARCGDTVILSPASTSFDRFSGFEERGDCFREIINRFLK